MYVTSIISGSKMFLKNCFYQKIDNLLTITCVKFTWNLSLSEKAPKNTHNGVRNSVCTYVTDFNSCMHMLAQLSTDVNARVPDLSRQRLVFFLPKLLLTIIIYCCCKSNHIPTILGCHGKIFGYVEAQAFTYTLVSSKFLRNVLR